MKYWLASSPLLRAVAERSDVLRAGQRRCAPPVLQWRAALCSRRVRALAEGRRDVVHVHPRAFAGHELLLDVFLLTSPCPAPSTLTRSSPSRR